MMKIAFIGNMNNMNFAMMRYFRDLGADAHLFLYKNSLSHFIPECDTWNIDKWAPFIHQTDIWEDNVSAIGQRYPFKPFYFIFFLCKSALGSENRFAYRSISDDDIKAHFVDYDAFIGTGLSAVILDRIGIKMDIFYPYSVGIEHLGCRPTGYLLNHASWGKRYITRHVAEAQKKAIKKARHCLNAELGLTKKTFEEIEVNFSPWAIPMVYNREKSPSDTKLGFKLTELRADIRSRDFAVLMHSRQMWVNDGHYTDYEWALRSKHNDWLIKSYAKFIKERPSLNPMLYMSEYGADVEKSKRLCTELAIQDNVRWLPKMPRKELMQIISWCDVGVGEFQIEHGCIWGGTGWEIMAVGKPLLQGYNFYEGEFEEKFGYPPPPMLPVISQECILKHLINMADHPEKAREIGRKAVDWFNKYNGIILAKKWLNLLNSRKNY